MWNSFSTKVREILEKHFKEIGFRQLDCAA